MKVLYFIRRFNSNTHTFVYNEVMGLVKRGVEVKVACTSRENPDIYPYDNLEVLPFSIPQRIWNNQWYKAGVRLKYTNTPLKKGIAELVERFQPDIIHCQFGPDTLYFVDNFQADSQIPIFITFHGFDASQMLDDKLYCERLNLLLQRKNIYPLFVSEHLKNNAASRIDIQRYSIFYCGIDTDFFTRKTTPSSDAPFRFLQVSSFREKKGQLYTLQAFAKLVQANPALDCELILTGEGEERKFFDQLCTELGITSKVIFTGFANRQQCLELMDKANVFVHHSITAANGDTEGLPTAIMEAMSMELPVLSTYHSGIPELVEHEVNGFLVPEKAVEEYASYMKEVIDWPYLPQNRQKVLDRFSNEAHSRILIGLYQKALQESTIA